MPRDIPDHPISPPPDGEAARAVLGAADDLPRDDSAAAADAADQDDPAATPPARPPTLAYLAPLLPIRAARQNIASYAHLYGAVVTRYRTPIETIAPAALCRIIRTAVETTHEGRRERAETIVRALALSIIGAEGEPLGVPRTAFDLLKRLSRQSLVARHVNGVAPDDGVPPGQEGSCRS
ncbi:MAG TPA: hypothetical protein VJR58_33820 [Vineibacter sp.]|nr:hypothetical protein [Vineibacter sp.]